MSRTKHGFFVSKGKIARTGEMDYLGSELGLTGARASDVIKVFRDKGELFSSETIKSYEGAPVTILHPDGLEVNSKNWKHVTVGHAQNIQQDGDHLVGDMFIHDESAINVIESLGIKELSPGHSSVVDVGAGDRFIQRNIIGNHVAIVPNGRGGKSCKLGDSAMKKDQRIKLTDSIKKILKIKIADSEDDAVKLAANEAKEIAKEVLAAVDESVIAEKKAEEEAVEAAKEDAAKAEKEKEEEELDEKEKYNIVNTELGASKKENADLKSKMAELEDKLKSIDCEHEKSTVLNDALLRFPNIDIKSEATAREIRQKILCDSNVFTSDHAKLMSDEEIKAAYAGYASINKKKSALGKIITGDAKSKILVNLNSKFGRKEVTR